MRGREGGPVQKKYECHMVHAQQTGNLIGGGGGGSGGMLWSGRQQEQLCSLPHFLDANPCQFPNISFS